MGPVCAKNNKFNNDYKNNYMSVHTNRREHYIKHEIYSTVAMSSGFWLVVSILYIYISL